MKKVLIVFIGCLLAAVAATGQVAYDVTLSGIDDLTLKTVYLLNLDDGSVLGSWTSQAAGAAAAEAKDGKARFQGEVPWPVLATLSASEEVRRDGFLTFVLDGEPIAFEEDELTKGSALNKRLNGYMRRDAEISAKQQALMTEYRELYERTQGKVPQDKMQPIAQRYEELDEERQKLQWEALKENQDNLIPVFYLMTSAEGLGYDKVAEYLKTYKYADRPALTPLRQTLEREKGKMPGAKAIDFAMPNLEGKQVSLTDYVGRGNYVLVDFWASWCGPCRADMPHVKSLYEKYHPKGFEIVGVSLDNKREAWEKGVKDLGIPWPQMSDLKGWQCEGAGLYNIRAIPATILFAPDGTVVEAGLRGETLTRKLKEIYGN